MKLKCTSSRRALSRGSLLMRFAELSAGKIIQAGPRSVTAAEIIDFAKRYDPQWFHTDPDLAARGRWRGLIASGWHGCAIAMELAVGAVLQDSESFGSPGVENIKWLEPIRPDDALTLRVEVLESRTSSSGGTGILRSRWGLWNQAGKQVLELTGTSLFELQPK